MRYIQGDLITETGVRQAYVEINEQTTTLHHGTAPNTPESTSYILTGVINAHTHLGDAFIRHRGITLPHDVKALVGPPNGLKHQLLRSASNEEIVASMRRALRTMQTSGTMAFCDFREGGLPGITQLQEATTGSTVQPLIMARPQNLKYKRRETKALFDRAHGIGISGIQDWPRRSLEKLTEQTKKAGKLFALHASEATREDIDAILALEPDFLIHCTKATKADLQKIADANIPVVLCPRSYHFFNITVDYTAFKDSGIQLMLGSDNAMLQTPNILDDVRTLQTTGTFPTESLLKMITVTPRKVLKIPDRIQGLNPTGHLVVLEKQSLNPLVISPTPTPGVEQP